MSVSRRSTAQAILEQLREEITRGDLPPLARLFEAELADRLSVSRTPLREALRQLEAEGFADRLPTGGMIVAGMDPDDLRELFWLRGILEGRLVEEVAATATAEQVSDLQRIIERMEASNAYPDQFIRLGREFHDELAALFRNERCRNILRQVRNHLDRYWAVTSSRRPDRPGFATAEHRAILAAMRERDPAKAGAAMRAHIVAESAVCLETAKLGPRRLPEDDAVVLLAPAGKV